MPSDNNHNANALIGVDVQRALESSTQPSDEQFQRWVSATVAAVNTHQSCAEVSIRLVDADESQALNRDYRQKDKPTNVLSFPTDFPAELEIPLLGDLVICTPVVEQEAAAQGKTLEAHWAHMTIHGTLHLLGYDHIDDHEAEQMEALETQLLTELHYPPPYNTDTH